MKAVAVRKFTLHEAMAFVGEMAAIAGKPECYRWTAKWWRLSARESKIPHEHLQTARAQLALYHDMLARPVHYLSSQRPAGMSDWQWSGLPPRISTRT